MRPILVLPAAAVAVAAHAVAVVAVVAVHDEVATDAVAVAGAAREAADAAGTAEAQVAIDGAMLGSRGVSPESNRYCELERR